MMCTDNKSNHSSEDFSDSSTHSNDGSIYTPLEGTILKKDNTSRKKILAQIYLTSAVMLTAASCGMPFGYSAILLPQLKNSNSSLPIDEEMGSWIASVHSAATPLGALLSGLLMDRMGRKVVLQLSALPLIIGWTLIALSPSYPVLLAGRVVAGLSAGLSAATGQVLIGESTEPHLRGMFSSGPFASYSFGILLVYAVGSVLPWRIVAGISLIPAVLAILLLAFFPESPVFLIRQNKYKKALEALTWLRGGDTIQAKEEADHLQQRVKNESLLPQENTFKLLLKPHVIKPLLIINIFNILQILSGTYIIVLYAVDMLRHMKSQAIDDFLVASLTSCVRFVFTVIASLLLAVVGRRTLVLTSGIGTAITALCLGVVLFQECQGTNSLVAPFLLIYVALNTVGFFVLPGVLTGELFPAKIRGHAGGLTYMFFNFTLFGVSKLFPLIKNLVGMHGVFWIFGTSSLLATVFLYLVLPETKGKTLSYIEDYFQQKVFIWIKRDRNWENKFHGNECQKLNV